MTEHNEGLSVFGLGMFPSGVLVGISVSIWIFLFVLIGMTNGDTFVRDGIRYGSVCEDLASDCDDWFIIGDAVKFEPTPVVIEVVK